MHARTTDALTGSRRPPVRAKARGLLRSVRRFPGRLAHAAAEAVDVLRWAATFQLRAGLARRRDVRLIRRSGLFDVAFYLAQCGGDPAARRNPIRHYVERGAALGLDPSPLFETAAHAGATGAPAPGNPLAQFIRSGGAGWREVVSAPSPPPLAIVPTREPSLVDPPFRPPSQGAARALVAVERVLAPDRDPRAARLLAILGLLREMGHAVTFVSEDADPPPAEDGALRALGCRVLRGFPAAIAHLVEDGHRYGNVILSGAEQAFRHLPSVRAYAPQATVIYDCGLEFVAMAREAELGRDAEKRMRADRLRRIERSNVTCADVVLVASDADRDVLLGEVPGASVEVLPDVPTAGARPEDAHLSPGELKAHLASILSPSGAATAAGDPSARSAR